MLRWLLFGSLICISTLSFASQDLILKTGSAEIIPSHEKAWVENGKILKLEETPQGFVVKGLKPGKSLLKIGQQIKTVYVLSLEQEKTFRLLQDVTAQALNLTCDFQDGHVVVKGQLLRWKDLEKIFHACRDNDCVFEFSAKSSSEVQRQIASHVQTLLKAEGLSVQNILFGDGYRVLLNQKSEHLLRLKKFFAAFGFIVEITKESLDLVPVVKVQITIAEVTRDKGLTYGMQWPGSASVQVLPTFGANLVGGDGGADNGNLVAHFLESHNLGKILASPNILCRSGEEAKFLAGGEFPIKIINLNTRDVMWKQYGILLTVKPKADLSGKISLSVQTEVSKVVGDLIDGIPQLETNRVESNIDLSHSQMIALSGLIRNDEDQKTTGLPGLGNIPILGPLFASKDFQEHRTELVIFLKPEIVDLQQQAGNL